MLKIIALTPINEPGGTLVHQKGSDRLCLWPGPRSAFFLRHSDSRASCRRICRIGMYGGYSGRLGHPPTVRGADISTQWHEPDVAMIHLASGQTVLAEINGRDRSGTSGYVFVQGREIEVACIADTNEWEEVSA